MSSGHFIIKQSGQLSGTVPVYGAKNAVLVIMTSLILTNGVSVLDNVPNNADVRLLMSLLQHLGAIITFDVEAKRLTVDASTICRFDVLPEMMNKIRASILVMGPLLARFGQAKVALPGGDAIGMRPINYHLQGFKKFGIAVSVNEPYINAHVEATSKQQSYTRIVLEYPSVGATENLLMYSCLGMGQTVIINAALEPEIFDLIDVLTKMGAKITILPGATLLIDGVNSLNPVAHSIIPDRLEAGSLLVAAAITKGSITIPNARPDHLDIFIEKLREMGHSVVTGIDTAHSASPLGITFTACQNPQAISIKTAPYPGFPTDLQPCLLAALTVANGISTIEETVHDNRMLLTKELNKMGAQISVVGTKATIRGVETLYGADVIAPDLRAACALLLAGLVAEGQTKLAGINHWYRGYDKLEERLIAMGALIYTPEMQLILQENLPTTQLSL
jgi:UDP-N-acetylglucosamine 1-carboxyvinyltransferase